MSTIIAESLASLGVQVVFGIVGIPVIEVAQACQDRGIRFIGFRNEQAASYAASIYGYLTGKPGVCLSVGGPGVIHSLAGVDNASANRFPMLLLSGSSETHQRGKGAFQQLDQVALLRPLTKFAEQPASVHSLPELVEQAYRTAYFGRPGPTYIDLPADIIQSKEQALVTISDPGAAPKAAGDPLRIQAAVDLLKRAKSPLLIVGKGAAYAQAELQVRQLQRQTGISFLPTPMGKGVIPDSNEFNTSAARSAALKSADVVLLFGARLNWILHYGEQPKFAPGVQIIQVDTSPEELGSNGGSPHLGIWGDVGVVATQLSRELVDWRAPRNQQVFSIKATNEQKAAKAERAPVAVLNYKQVYAAIRDLLPSDTVFVSEGANTMDISRTSFPLDLPRTRLDAGTNATMGVGLGYAIAAKAAHPDRLVVAIEGDSAFGFSGLEIDTAVRNNLPIVVFVMNNSGVYHGVDPALYSTQQTLPPTALGHNTKYHDLATSLGADGYLATTLEQVKDATKAAIASNRVAVINIIIDPGKDKKLEFGWMASTKPKI